MEWYELIGQTPVKVEGDVLAWAERMETSDRKVAATCVLGLCCVSTVFLSVDLGRRFGGPPILFETMAFWVDGQTETMRCSTWLEAEAQHAEMCRDSLQLASILIYLWREMPDIELVGPQEALDDVKNAFLGVIGIEALESAQECIAMDSPELREQYRTGVISNRPWPFTEDTES